jgi:hypothetical protein
VTGRFLICDADCTGEDWFWWQAVNDIANVTGTKIAIRLALFMD